MKTRVTSIIICLLSMFAAPVLAQENPLDTLTSHVAGIRSELDVLKRIKVSGYIQAQYQVADSGGAPGYAGGNFASGQDKRFQLRRARVKVQYDSPLNDKGWSTSQYVFQIDGTQNGVTIKDMYAKFTDPWSGYFSITAGMQNRPFGYEIPFSSSLRESPERGRMSQIIFPNERDLGAMLTIQGPKTSNWNWIKFDVGYFNGTGGPGAGANTSDFDKFKDVIGHVAITKSTKSEMIKWGLGASFYEGGFRQDVVNSYKFGTDSAGVNGFTIDKKKADVSATINNRAEIKRSYVGFDGQVSIDWFLGLTTIRAEYIQGTQPGTSGSSASPASTPTGSTVITSTSTSNSTLVLDSTGTVIGVNTTTTTNSVSSTPASDLYNRKFNGAYFYFVQNIGHSPWQAIVKYDWYDPNTDVKGDEIGKKAFGNTTSTPNTTNATDLKYTTLGLGMAYRWDAAVKITAYYDMVKNETSNKFTGASAIYNNDLEDNVFTLRVQVKF